MDFFVSALVNILLVIRLLLFHWLFISIVFTGNESRGQEQGFFSSTDTLNTYSTSKSHLRFGFVLAARFSFSFVCCWKPRWNHETPQSTAKLVPQTQLCSLRYTKQLHCLLLLWIPRLVSGFGLAKSCVAAPLLTIYLVEAC